MNDCCSDNFKNNVPRFINQGSTVTFTVTLAEYAPSDGWTLTFTLRGAGDGLDVTGTQQSVDTFLVSLSPTQTGGLAVGTYYYGLRVSKGGDSYLLAQGQVEVTIDLSALPNDEAYDGRSKYQVIIDTLDAAIAGRLNKMQQSYTIGNRQLTLMSMDDLLKARGVYQRLEEKRLNQLRTGSGKSPFKTVKTKFTRQ